MGDSSSVRGAALFLCGLGLPGLLGAVVCKSDMNFRVGGCSLSEVEMLSCRGVGIACSGTAGSNC